MAADHNYPTLSHEPIHAARGTPQTDPGEHAYLEEWHALVRTPIPFDECEDEADEALGPLNRILIAIPGPLGDQESRWAAEFVKWLGTNVGMSVGVGRGSRHNERVRDEVLMRWAECNARRTWVNQGYRVSDYLTSPEWNRPELCREAMALEVFEQLALWLGSTEGQEFIQRAEARFSDYAMARRQCIAEGA